MEVYPLVKADPTTTQALLQSLVPDAKISLDLQTKKLVALAVPDDQKAVKAVVDQLEAENPPGKQPQFETYPVFGLDVAALVKNLQTAVPNGKFMVDEKAGKLVVFGTPSDQETVKTALEKLRGGPANGAEAQLQVYRLTKADAATATALLQSVVPQAKLTVDPQTKILIALATPADQLTIKTTLDQLQPKAPPDAPELRIYPLAQPLAASLVTAVSGLVPKAQVSMDPGGKRLSAVATPEDHAVIKAAIEQLEMAAALDEKGKLVVYPVTPVQQKRLQAVMATLTTELPGIQTVADGEPGQLSIWAKPSQHLVIAEILSQLKRDVPGGEKCVLAAYPVKSGDPASVLKVLQTLFPNLQFVLDAKARRVIVWTLPAEQEAVKAAMEKLDAAVPAETREKLMVYPVPQTDPATAVTLLKEAVPDMTLSADARTGSVLAWGRQSDHELLAKMLKQMNSPDPEFKPQLVIYPLASGDATNLAAMLRTLVPNATVAVDAKTGGLAATATPREHELIRAAVEQLAQKETAETARRMVIYTLPSAGPGAMAGATATLTTIFPDVKFVPGAERGKLVVWARPAEHDEIRKAIDEMGKKEPPETAHALATYTVESTSPYGISGIIATLTPMFPDARIAAGSEPDKVIAWARPADQKAIRAAIDQMAKEPAETARKAVVYNIESASPSAVSAAVSVLTTIYPNARFVAGTEPGKLVAHARPAEHAEIKKTIDQLAQKDPPEMARRMVIYTLESAGPAGVAGASATLSTVFPDAKFVPGAEPEKLAVWARPADHAEIGKAIEEIGEKEPPEKAHSLAAYTIETTSPYGVSGVVATLTQMFPDARIAAGSEPDKVIAWARPADQKAIQAAVEQMAKKDPVGTAERRWSTTSHLPALPQSRRRCRF